jgi:N-acetylneuraminate synthase
MKRVFQKSIVTVRAVAAGERLTRDALGFRKPGTGLAPQRLPDVVGRRATRPLPSGTIVQVSDLSDTSA